MSYTFPTPYIYPATVTSDYPTAGTSVPNPSRPLSEGIKANTITFAADSGHEQRRSRSNSKRTFSLNYIVLTADQYKTLRDFYMNVTNVNAFAWTHPIEKTVLNVKFAMDTFSGENFEHNAQGPLYKLQLSLEETW